ncbi:hypothetical protein ACFV3O_34015, partial [Streptomyces albidoflavus]
MRETTQVKEVGTRSGEEPQEEAKRIDLSVPQVAGGARGAGVGGRGGAGGTNPPGEIALAARG